MRVLDRVDSPADLRRLDPRQLNQLAREVREFLVDAVCRTGGHLGPNLGVVELTLALHRVFDSPEEPIVFDTGHQSYVHKLVTGRREGFGLLRTGAGLSGYPNRAESVHDVEENSHASTALSYADGLSKSFAATGDRDRPVVAVIGDGALTGGLAWEALNNLGRSGRHVVVVLNDNGHSYAPTAGALPGHLQRLADRPGYADVAALLGGERRLDGLEGADGAADVAGAAASGTGPGARAGTRAGAPEETGGLFGALGFTYLGPVDGHDLAAVEDRLRAARDLTGPVLVHCLTEKGRGYEPAERDTADHLHTVGVVDAGTGRPAAPPSPTWTDAFADALVELGAERRDLVAVSAAMLGPTGLQRFADRYPGRCHDVGIAEQHALTSAAGMAMGGLHPVVALYATFANRAFDQELLDVGMHKLPVTLVLDRAGVTGPDGPSHHGMWDLAMLGIVPGIRVAAPRDAQSLAEELEEALAVDGPTAIRFPKAKLGPALPALRRVGDLDVLREGEDVLLVAVGAMGEAAVAAAERLEDAGITCTVVDPRWALPVSAELTDLAARHRLVVTVEDGVRVGGVGSHVVAALADRGVDVPVRCLGLPGSYLRHGSRAELLAVHKLDAAGLCASVEEAWERTGGRTTLSLVTTAEEDPLPGRSAG